MNLIAIDLGTSFIKGAILNLNTLQMNHVTRIPFPEALTGLPGLYREYDSMDIVAAVRSLLHQLVAVCDEADGLVMCSQMHGLVFTDEEGNARSNLTTWQDQRVLLPHPSGGGTYFDVLAGRLNAEELRQLGNELRPGLPVGVLFWLAEQGQLPAPALIAATLPDFILANLCAAPPCVETTNAMAHGLLNLETLDWHTSVIAKLGLQKLRLPELKAHGEVVGWMRFHERDIPCYTPIGDYQCAILGSLLGEGELSLNISTGSQVSLLKPTATFGDFQTRPFFDGNYLIGITHIPAGRALNALVKLLSELAAAQGVHLDDPWPYIAEQAAASGQTCLHVDLAFFSSSVGDHGEITNIQEDELTVGHLFHAAFQNMADNYLSCARRLLPEQTWSNLVFSGGLVQKMDVLRQMICEQFGVGYRLSPSPEDTLLGLLVLGMVFTGRADSVSDAITQVAKFYDTAIGGSITADTIKDKIHGAF